MTVLSLQASALLGHLIREENSFLVSYETQVTPEGLKAVNAANQSTPSVLNFTQRWKILEPTPAADLLTTASD